MRVIHTIKELRSVRNALKGKVGFVPTMGALHEGHLSLVKHAKTLCDHVFVSVFVNPSQFAPHEDLDRYPRTLDADCALLDGLRIVEAVFSPSVNEMYPSGIVLNVADQVGTFIEVKGKSHQLEGSIRPHFFRGVATVVCKLLNAVDADVAVFGQKDGQQCVVVRSLATDLLMKTQIVIAPTTREADGLAMSSRNRYLSPEERAVAPALYKALDAGRSLYQSGVKDSKAILAAANAALRSFVDANTTSQVEVQFQYLSISHPRTLDELDTVGSDGAMFSGAVLIGKTRIIDNILLTTDSFVSL